MFSIENVTMIMGMSDSKARRVLGIMNRQKLPQSESGVMLALGIMRDRSEERRKSQRNKPVITPEQKREKREANAILRGTLRKVTQNDIGMYMTYFGIDESEAVDAILGGVALD